MKQKIFGIDIGSYSVKVAVIERSFRSWELMGFYEQPIDYSVVTTAPGQEGGEAVSPQARALGRLVDTYDLRGDFLYTALPGQMTAFRGIELPFTNFKKIDTTIEFELENYLPLSLEEVVEDYLIATQEKDRSKVLVSYARKTEFLKFLNIFAACELDPRFVGSEPAEMANLHKMGVVTPEGNYAIVDLGHEKTNVCLFVKNSLYSARTLMIGGKGLTRSLSVSLSIPEAEAERIKLEMGQVGEPDEGADAMTRQVTEALQVPLQELLIQLKQTFLAFEDESGGEAVEALLLTGGTSRLPGLDQFLSRGLRRNVSFLEPLEIPANRLPDTQWCRSVGATALALAYRGVVGVGTRDLQFRRGEFAYRGELRDLSGLVREVLIQAAIITGVVLFTFFLSYFSLSGRIRQQEDQLATLAAEILPELPKKSLSNPKNVLSILAGRVNEMAEKKGKIQEEVSFSVLEVLKEISSKLPVRETLRIDVDELTMTGGKIRLTGRTDTFEAVDQIKTALSQSKQLQNVTTQDVRKGTGDEVKFQMALELKEEGGADGA